MRDSDKLDLAALCIFALFMIVVLIFLMVPRQQTNGEQSGLSVPHDYHILYDDANNMIIVPKEYHFKCDEKGNMVLTK